MVNKEVVNVQWDPEVFEEVEVRPPRADDLYKWKGKVLSGLTPEGSERISVASKIPRPIVRRKGEERVVVSV